MTKEKISIQNPYGWNIPETYTATRGLHCPLCSSSDMVIEDGEGDYYMGSLVVCRACGGQGYISFGEASNSKTEQKRASSLKRDRPTVCQNCKGLGWVYSEQGPEMDCPACK